MNAMVFGLLVCALFALAGIVACLVVMLRVACSWCGIPKPAVLPALTVIGVTFIAELIADAIVQGGIYAGYEAAGLPPWEAATVIFFLVIPVDFVVASVVHAGLMRISLGKSFEVWFVQRLMLLGVVLLLLGAGAITLVLR